MPQTVRCRVAQAEGVLEKRKRKDRERHIGRLDVYTPGERQRSGNGKDRINRAKFGCRSGATPMKHLGRMISAGGDAAREHRGAKNPWSIGHEQHHARVKICDIGEQKQGPAEFVLCEPTIWRLPKLGQAVR